MSRFEDGYYKIKSKRITDEPNNPFRDGQQVALKFHANNNDVDAYTDIEDSFNGDKDKAKEWMEKVKYIIIKDDDMHKVAMEL